MPPPPASRWRVSSQPGATRSTTKSMPGRHRAGLALAATAGEVLRTSHNGLLPAGPAFVRRAHSAPGLRVTPVMSCAPQRLQRGQPGTARRARIPQFVRSRLRRHRKRRIQALRAEREEHPAHPAGQMRRGRAAVASLLARRICSAPRPPSPPGAPLKSNRHQPNAASMRCKPCSRSCRMPPPLAPMPPIHAPNAPGCWHTTADACERH